MKIVFMDGYDSVRDAKTQGVEIFSTILPADLSELLERPKMVDSVIDNVVVIFNEKGLKAVDDYLLDEEQVSQDEREIIVEALVMLFPASRIDNISLVKDKTRSTKEREYYSLSSEIQFFSDKVVIVEGYTVYTLEEWAKILGVSVEIARIFIKD